MLSSASGLSGKSGGGPNSSENYLMLGFLFARPSQSVLLLVRQAITQDNCSILVSYPSSCNVISLKNLFNFKKKDDAFKKGELGQETIKNKIEGFPFSYEI